MTPARAAAIVAICVLTASCSGGGKDDAGAVVARSGESGEQSIPPAELEAAATDVVAFLRGTVPFERLRLADTVVLYVSPEGGGASAPFARERLSRPSAWVVRSGGQDRAFAPPDGHTRLTTRVGRHLACTELSLSSRFPHLAPLPHVGTMLAPEPVGSCLQSWNLTLVFDPAARPPRLVAAVHDQWEW